MPTRRRCRSCNAPGRRSAADAKALTSAASSAPHEPHRAFGALRQPGYGAYLTGSMLAMMADSIEHVISYWMIFQKFHSPALGGYAVISHWFPFLLFSVYSGALADRFDPRRIIQCGMVLFMLCSLAWGVLFMSGTLQVWHAVAIFTVHGFAGVLWAPASQLLIHDIVGRSQLHSAVRLLAVSRVLGLLGGPAIGGAMLLTCGPSTGMLVNALIYLPLIVWLWKAPFGPRFRNEPAPTPRPAGGGFDGDRGDRARNRRQPGGGVDDAGRRRLVVHPRQRLSGADARIRRRSRPWRRGLLLQHAAGGQCRPARWSRAFS